MSEISDLIKKKKEIEREIKNKKMENKKDKKNNSISKANVLVRISRKFNDILDNILKELEGKGFRISKPKLTDLIIKHKNWGEVENDCINFDFKKE